MFRVITVAREYGSGGAAVARRVAELLGWSLLDGSLVGVVARRAQVDIEMARRYDESVDSWWRRFHRAGIWSAAVDAGVSPAEAELFDAETMAAYTHEVIQEAALKGNCVIVGRGAQCVLRDSPEAFHVFVYGSWPERIARARERFGQVRDAASVLRSFDRTRAACIRRYFKCDWKDPHLYHMMISSQPGIGNVASMVVSAVCDSESPAASAWYRTIRYPRN